MEKIKKALEKARQKRLGAPGTDAADGACGPAAVRNAQQSAGSKDATCRMTKVVSAPADAMQEGRIVAGLTGANEIADTFRMLRTQVLRRLAATGYSTMAITSARRGEGKSLTAINLAASLALHVSRTVLLVDLDLRCPRVHTCFGIEPELGLSDYLLDDVPIADCFVNPGVERLVLLPVRKPLEASSELLSSPKMIRLAQELKERYPDRIVLYDLPPVLISADALDFLQHVECCLFVIGDGSTSRSDVQRSLELLKGCHILGTVLNKSTETVMSYPYGD